jgi:hypothetical protein
MSDTLAQLSAWYLRHCDGDWEHQSGIEISTLDNPGWRVTVDLEGTELEPMSFTTCEDSYEDEVRWLRCWREGLQFNAACGPERLEDAIRIFLSWAESAPHGI